MSTTSEAGAKRVLVPIANGSEDIESSSIIDVFRRARFAVDVASVGADKTVTLARGMRVTADMTMEEAARSVESAGRYDLIALPGGMPGAEHLRDCATLTSLLTTHAAAGKHIAAICAAPAVVLVPHGLITATCHATCHPNFVDRLPHREAVSRRVVVDTLPAGGKLITSRGPGTSLEFALQCVATVAGVDQAIEVAKPMVMHEGLALV